MMQANTYLNHDGFITNPVQRSANIVQGWPQREDEFNPSTAQAAPDGQHVFIILKGGLQHEVEYPEVPGGSDAMHTHRQRSGASVDATRAAGAFEPFDEASWRVQCGIAFEEAFWRSGQSDYMFTHAVHSLLVSKLERIAPEHQRVAFKIAQEHGYLTEETMEAYSDWNSESGYCSHGFEFGCCPV